MLKAVCIGAALFLFVGLANAQAPTSGNIFVGYSFENASSTAFNTADLRRPNLQGWEATLEGKVFPFMGIVADFSGHYGSSSFQVFPPGPPGGGPFTTTVTGHEEEVMFGPRFSVPVGKFRPFAELEFGVGHINTNNGFGSDTSFATALGGGLDYRIFRPLAWRFQGDYVSTRFFGATQNDIRCSTGIVFRF
jgi:hypothetical protein